MMRIKEWDKRFESAKSRTYKLKSQAYMPNKIGIGYMRMMRDPDGPAIYGAWCALVCMISRMECPRYGYLTDTGRDSGVPLNIDSISMLTMIPVGIVSKMIDFCTSHDVAWLVNTTSTDTATDTTVSSPRIPDGPSPLPLPLPSPLPLPLPSQATSKDFDLFWTAYPKKVSKGAAKKAWDYIIHKRPPTDKIVSAIEAQKLTADWQKNGGQFIPHPATWLRANGWENDISSMNAGGTNGQPNHRRRVADNHYQAPGGQYDGRF